VFCSKLFSGVEIADFFFICQANIQAMGIHKTKPKIAPEMILAKNPAIG